MLNVYVPGPKGLERVEVGSGAAIPDAAIWLDLLNPTAEEEKQVEQCLAIDVPSREEMREIETSNRLYEDNGTLYLTTTVVYKVDTDLPETTQVTFILSGARLITALQRLSVAAQPMGRLVRRANP